MSEFNQNPKKIERLRRSVRNNHPIPPIELGQMGNKYLIEDGHHRFIAHKLENKSYIKANVLQYPERKEKDENS